ncbi:hypothetical protein OG1X_0500 [Enterococcus faecalis OG1X]|nr:hypothetical protein OG1X_0500 [Enterococcus faecalis OG1X]
MLWLGWIECFNLCHHAAIFVLNDMAVIHINPWQIKANQQPNRFTRIHANGIFETIFIWIRRMPIPRQD